MSDGLFASSLHNNIISWEVSDSIDGDYSASFSLSNEEGQYDASIIPAIYSSDNHLLQRACAIKWAPVEAFLDVKLAFCVIASSAVACIHSVFCFFMDQFIFISLPGLVFLIAWCYKNENWPVAAVLAPSIFNLLIYPTISFNIPRYQLTALPALSLATMFSVMWFIRATRGRK